MSLYVQLFVYMYKNSGTKKYGSGISSITAHLTISLDEEKL